VRAAAGRRASLTHSRTNALTHSAAPRPRTRTAAR
jgi:hypothetical protein